VAAPVYLTDTTVHVLQRQHESVRHRIEALVLDGRLAMCQMSAMEYLNNAPNPRAYEQMWGVMHTQRWIDVDVSAMNRAMDVHRKLAKQSCHRHFALPDLIIAAAAELNGATVLHYDGDYDRIAAVTGQPVEWVVPRGSL